MTFERYVNQIISFVDDRQTVRRETRDKFIDKLQNTIDSNHITADKNIAKILFDTVVECTEVKKNKFEMKIRRFIHSMFNDKETADNIVKSVLS